MVPDPLRRGTTAQQLIEKPDATPTPPPGKVPDAPTPPPTDDENNATKPEVENETSEGVDDPKAKTGQGSFLKRLFTK